MPHEFSAYHCAVLVNLSVVTLVLQASGDGKQSSGDGMAATRDVGPAEE